MELPGKSLVRPSQSGGEVSPSAGGAVWQALGNVGQQLSSLGDKAVDTLVKIKQADVRRQAADMTLEFDQLQTDFENEVFQNPNITPEQVQQGWEKATQAFQSKYQREGMSPLEQDALGTRSKQLIQAGGSRVFQSALTANLQNSKQSYLNLVDAGIRRNNLDMVNEGLDALGAIYPKAQVDKIRADVEGQMTDIQINRAISENPLGMAEKLKDEKDVLSEFPGISAASLPRYQDEASRAVRKSVSDNIDGFSDGLATNSVKSNDDIERIYGGRVPPRILEQMKGELLKRDGAAQKAFMNSPAYRFQQEGEASALVNSLATTSGEQYQQNYAAASFAVSQMDDSPAKLYLKEKMTAAKEGRDLRITTNAQEAFRTLDAFDDRERAKLPPAPQMMNTADAIEAGFLSDKEKLAQVGVNDTIWTELDKAKNNQERARILREKWSLRDMVRVDNADHQVLKTAEAIISGSNQIDYVSPEAQDAATAAAVKQQLQSGERRLKLSDWLSVNKEASAKEIEEKVFEIAGEQARADMQSNKFLAPPQRVGGFIPGETSMNLPSDLAPLRQTFVEVGTQYGIDPRFLAAISMFETDKGRSGPFKEKNNAMGVSNSLGPVSFGSHKDSIVKMARLLGSKTGGPYKDSFTISEIGSVYAPVGAGNDVNGTNADWPAGVAKYYKELGGNPTLRIK